MGYLPPLPGVNWQTNWKHYLPHPSDAGGKNSSEPILCNGMTITTMLNFDTVTLTQATNPSVCSPLTRRFLKVGHRDYLGIHWCSKQPIAWQRQYHIIMHWKYVLIFSLFFQSVALQRRWLREVGDFSKKGGFFMHTSNKWCVHTADTETDKKWVVWRYAYCTETDNNTDSHWVLCTCNGLG